MREISVVKERIMQYLNYKGISKYKFYQKTGITNGVLSQPNGISEENTLKFLSCFSDISPEWLLTGEGDMIKKAGIEDAKEASERCVLLPLIPISAVAGFDGSDNRGVLMNDCKLYSVPDFAAAGAEYLIKVSGDSMLPRYHNGDVLACRKLTEINFIQWGHIYVVDSSQGAMVKRLYEVEDDDMNVMCRSDNAEYPPFKIPKADIRSLSIIVGLIRLE